MRRTRLIRISPRLGAALFLILAPAGAHADARAVVACRRLPPGPARAACLERTSAELERELAATDAARAPAPSEDPASVPLRRTRKAEELQAARAQARALEAARRPAHAAEPIRRQAIEAVATKVTYADDGSPIFELDDGSVWASQDARHVGFKGDGEDLVRITPAPEGWLLHFRGSYWGLSVVRRR